MFNLLHHHLPRLRLLKAPKRHNKHRKRDSQGSGARPALRLMCRTGRFRLRHPTRVNTVNKVNTVNTVNTRELFKSLPAR